MTVETTYTKALEHLASYFDKAVADRGFSIVRRRKGGNAKDVTIVSAEELESLQKPVEQDRISVATFVMALNLRQAGLAPRITKEVVHEKCSDATHSGLAVSL